MGLVRGTYSARAQARSPFATSRRTEDAVVAHEVSPRRRHQRGETAEQLARLADEDLAAVAEAPLHAVRELPVGKRREPLLRERLQPGASSRVQTLSPRRSPAARRSWSRLAARGGPQRVPRFHPRRARPPAGGR